MSRIAVVIGFCLLSVLAGSSVSAGSLCGGCGDKVREAFIKSIEVVTPDYDACKENLLSKEPAEWNADDIFYYLQSSLRLIYYANCLQLLDHNSIPIDPQAPESSGYLTEWPLNPFNAWQPIIIRDLSEGFYPGDVSREICPPDYYTGGKARSFELYIYGPTIDFIIPVPSKESTNPWAVKPAGTVYDLGLRAESDMEREAREQMLNEE